MNKFNLIFEYIFAIVTVVMATPYLWYAEYRGCGDEIVALNTKVDRLLREKKDKKRESKV